MLEGLKSVRWKELSHAYGDANDLPKLLRTLTSEHEEKRTGAVAPHYLVVKLKTASKNALEFHLSRLKQTKKQTVRLLTHHTFVKMCREAP